MNALAVPNFVKTDLDVYVTPLPLLRHVYVHLRTYAAAAHIWSMPLQLEEKGGNGQIWHMTMRTCALFFQGNLEDPESKHVLGLSNIDLATLIYYIIYYTSFNCMQNWLQLNIP